MDSTSLWCVEEEEVEDEEEQEEEQEVEEEEDPISCAQSRPPHDLPRHAFKSAPVCPHLCAGSSLLHPLSHTHSPAPATPAHTHTCSMVALNRHRVPCAQSCPHT